MRGFLISTASAATLLAWSAPAAAQIATSPRGYKCADENGVCAYEGKGTLYYGADDRWFVQTHTLPAGHGIVCGNGQFGDPVPNVYKACYVELGADPVVSQPDGWLCANEGEWCGFSGQGTVYYGAYDAWAMSTRFDGASCSNAEFGDPLVGYAKACYVVPASPQTISSPSSPPPPPPPPAAPDWRPEAQAAEGCWMSQLGEGYDERWVVLETTEAGVEIHDVYLDTGTSREPGLGWTLNYSRRYEPASVGGDGHASFGDTQQAFWFSDWNRAFSQDSREFLRYYKFPLDASIPRQSFTRWTSCGDGCQQPYTYEAPTPTWDDCNRLLQWAKED